MHPRTFRSHRTSAAFTYAELLMATFVMGLVVATAVGFLLFSLRVYGFDSGRMQVNRDVRKITQRMMTDTAYASAADIFADYATRGTNHVTAAIGAGAAGNMLVLTYCDSSPTTGFVTVNKLIAYYLVPSGSPAYTGPIRRFETVINPAVQLTDIYALCDLLDDHLPSQAGANPTIVQLAKGNAGTNQLFYNYMDRSVMVKAKIYQVGSVLHQGVISTYNFTISPRG